MMFNFGRCHAIFIPEEDIWECAWCGFTTDDDIAARRHGANQPEVEE